MDRDHSTAEEGSSSQRSRRRVRAALLATVPLALMGADRAGGSTPGEFRACSPSKYGCGIFGYTDNRPGENNWNMSYAGPGCAASYYQGSGQASSTTMSGVVNREWFTYQSISTELGNPSVVGTSNRRCSGSNASPQALALGAVNTKKVGIGVTLHISGSVVQYCAGDPNCGGGPSAYGFSTGGTR